MKAKPEYVPSKEGEKLLGVKRQSFFYYVKKGRIRKILGEKRGKTLYNYDDILQLRKELGRDTQALATVVDWIRPSDLPNALALDFLVYQESVIGDINLYLSWLKRNPHIALAVFDATNRNTILAYITMLPLPEEVILSVLKGERTETSIRAEEIETYERSGKYVLLAESAVSHPDHKEYIATLMRRFAHMWCEQWSQRQVQKIYAQAESADGEYLVQKLFFAPLYSFPDNAYVLDFQRRNPSKFIRRFQECVKAKSAALQAHLH